MKRNRGAAAVLAMIFLAVFAVLGVSFYTMATTSLTTASNDRQSQTASAGAESGLALIQRLVADVVIKESQGTGDQAMNLILGKLQAQLVPSTTMHSCQGDVLTITRQGDQILIPAEKNADGSQKEIAVSSTQGVSATITCAAPNDLYAPMMLQVTGHDLKSDIKRTVKVQLYARDRTLEPFTYGVFAKGRVDLADQKACIKGIPAKEGTLGSAYVGDTAIYLHGGIIDGNVTVVGDPATSFSTDTTKGSIGGVTITDPTSLAEALTHVRQVEPFTIPDFKPNLYYVSGLTPISKVSGNVYTDVVIEGTKTFNGGDVLRGTIYVKPGAVLNIPGNVTIEGVIVVEDPNLNMDGTSKGTNYTSTSTINFTGTPNSTNPVWPTDSVVPLDMQKELKDYTIFAPTAYIYMTGNTGGNTNTGSSSPNAGFAKTVLCGTMEQNGSGTVGIRDGTLLTMSDSIMSGGKGSYCGYFDGDGVLIQRSKDYKPPYGGYVHLFSWVVDPRTYQEGGTK